MRTRAMPPRPGLLSCVALLALTLPCPHFAHARIFGAVGTNGAIVLTNDPGNPRLKLIVDDSPAATTGNAGKAATAVTAAMPGALPSNILPVAQIAELAAEASRQTGVQAALLRAVIAVESHNNSTAVSQKGARGLMQLMPKTARRFSRGDMFNPRDNVLAGAHYLRFLLDLFKGDLALTLAAYNAGENAVIRAGMRIPAFAETQSYVPTVLARYRRLLASA